MAALAAACDSGEPAGPPSTTPRTGKPSPSLSSSPSVPPDGKEAKAILDRAFTGREALGGGSGPLVPRLGNTAPAPDKDVLSVTFAFTCTGNGEVAFTFAVDGKKVSSAAHTSPCDGSIFQKSLEIPVPGPVTFTADTTASNHGEFAYAYYPEVSRVP